MHINDVRKMVKKKKKKVKLWNDILTYKTLLLILSSAGGKKKFLLEGPDRVYKVSSWNVDISWPLSVKISAMDRRNIQHYCGFWFLEMFSIFTRMQKRLAKTS